MLSISGIFTLFTGCRHYPPVKGSVLKKETVVCVHGLFDSALSMRPMAKHLSKLGYDVHVVAYSSTRETIGDQIRTFERNVEKLNITEENKPVHFIGHSLGGIIIRGYLSNHTADTGIGRTVTVASPHKGSPWADRLSKYSLPRLIVVPVDGLKTSGDGSAVHLENPALHFAIGTIAGGTGKAAGFYPDMGEDNDGVVPESSTRLDGEKDHIVLPYTHSVIHWRRETIEQAAHFLLHGKFIHE